jgi:hypothetical protein
MTTTMFVAGFMSRSVWSQAVVFSRKREMSSVSRLSVSPLTWVRVTVVSSYDIFAINLASVMLGYVYGHGNGTLSTLESRM